MDLVNLRNWELTFGTLAGGGAYWGLAHLGWPCGIVGGILLVVGSVLLGMSLGGLLDDWRERRAK